MKKLIALAVAVVFIAAFFSTAAFAEENARTGDDTGTALSNGGDAVENNGREITAAGNDGGSAAPGNKAGLRKPVLTAKRTVARVTVRKELAEDRFKALKPEAVQGINQLRKNNFEKIRDLKSEELEKLKDLSAADIENFSVLKKDRLKTLVALKKDEIAKIKALKAEELRKVSGLKPAVRERLLGLNSEKIKKIVSAAPAASLPKLVQLRKEKLENLSELNEEEIAEVSQLDDAAIEDVASQPTPALARARLLKLAGTMHRERARFLLAKERFEFVREKFADAKENFLEKKRLFNAVKEEIQNAPEGEKPALRQQLREHAQDVLLNQVTAILGHLEAAKEKEIQIEGIDALVEKFTALQDSLDDENVSKETLVDAAKDIREAWRDAKQKIQLRTLEALNNRIGSLLEKAETAYNAVSAKVAEAKQAGKDTAKIEAALTVFKSRLDSLKQLNTETSALIESATADPAAADLLAKIRQDLRQQHRQIKNGYHLLKKIILGHRMAVKGQAVADIDVDEEAEEIEEPLGDNDEADETEEPLDDEAATGATE